MKAEQMTAIVNETYEHLKAKGISTDDIYAIAYELQEKIDTVWDEERENDHD